MSTVFLPLSDLNDDPRFSYLNDDTRPRIFHLEFLYQYKKNKNLCIDCGSNVRPRHMDRRLYNVTSVHSGSTDYATLVRTFYLVHY